MKVLVKVLLLITLFCGIASVPQASADELSELSQMLDYVEAHFWRGVVNAPASASRKVLENYSEQLASLATKVQNRRYYKTSRIDNPIEYATKLRVLVKSIGKSPERRILTGQTRTHSMEFRKYYKKQQTERQQKRFSVQEEIGIYEEFIEETRVKNLEKAEQRFRSGNKLTRLQANRFVKMADEFYLNVAKLRVNIFKLRRLDPAFNGKLKD